MEMPKKSKKKAEKPAKIAPKTDTSKIYELGLLLVPSLGDEKARSEYEGINKLFSNNGGELISSENPILIDLAYPMVKVIHAHREKCYEAYFGWMKFEIETAAITEIKKSLDSSESVLRYLLVKTVRENTLLNGKMSFGRGNEKMKRMSDEEVDVVKEEVPVEINQEELDKSIDDLVIV